MHSDQSRLSSTARIALLSPKGFTLIETVVGIVVLSIAFSIFTTLIYPLANQSAEQVHQIRAAELGQSMINEILGKAFDENSDKSGGAQRCGELYVAACTASNLLGADSLGADSESRATFDDVDDYDQLRLIESSLEDDLDDIYIGYQIYVEVINDSNYSGGSDSNDNNFTAKLITVTVTTPQDFNFVFSVYRVNF
jgi:MSHA pilin protein MshD